MEYDIQMKSVVANGGKLLVYPNTRPKSAARIVIGTKKSDWREIEVNKLCIGVLDQDIINAAIAELPENGGEIILLDGTYSISGPIEITKSNVTLRGSGATILKRSWNSSTREDGVIVVQEATNVHIKDMIIHGQRGEYTSSYNFNLIFYLTETGCSAHNVESHYSAGSGIGVFSSNECKLSLISSNNNTYNGIVVDNQSNNITITDCIARYNGTGINSINGKNLIISNNNVSNNPTGITSRNNQKTIISNNICNDANFGIISDSTRYSTISNNSCLNCQQGIHVLLTRDTLFANNLTYKLSKTYTSSEYSIILVNDDNHNNVVIGNMCFGKAPLDQSQTTQTVPGPNPGDPPTTVVINHNNNDFIHNRV